jgi:hypothetical protein
MNPAGMDPARTSVPAAPAVRLLRIGVPATTPGAVAARADMATRMAPEIQVVDIDTESPFSRVRAAILDAGPAELPWALLTLPGTVSVGAGLVRSLTAGGLPPARVLVRAEAPAARIREELEQASRDGEPLSCPVSLLLTVVDAGEPGGWGRLSRSAPVVRLLAPDEPLDAIAGVVKEELQVWPA